MAGRVVSAIDWLDERDRIEQAATEGEWRAEKHIDFSYEPGYSVYLAPADGGVFGADGDIGWACTKADAAYIADARTSLPKAAAALRAVLELHQPVNALNMRTNRVQPVCSERSCGQENGDFMAWPCPTVRAIEKAFES